MSVEPAILPLVFVVALAFTVEAALGFGSTVVTVAIASTFMPIEPLLAAFVPLNVVMSTYLVARYARHVDRKLLTHRVLPAVGLGMPLGMLGFKTFDEGRLKLVFGVFVVLLAALELWPKRGDKKAAPLPRFLGLFLLTLGGIVHGAFATGGPLVVYVLGRETGGDKARFRATLSVLWLVLNVVLVTSYVAFGSIDGGSMTTSAVLLAPLLAGLFVGEWAHGRLSAERFRALVFVLLGAVGLVLVVRTLMA